MGKHFLEALDMHHSASVFLFHEDDLFYTELFTLHFSMYFGALGCIIRIFLTYSDQLPKGPFGEIVLTTFKGQGHTKCFRYSEKRKCDFVWRATEWSLLSTN